MSSLPNKKVIIVGRSGVGKTCVLNTFLNGKDTFDANLAPTPSVYQRATIIELPETGVRIKLSIWDTLGQEKHRSIT
jgi:GTPase SAR1 family protein